MKPITMTSEYAQELANEFYAKLMGVGAIQASKYTYTKDLSVEKKNAITVDFTSEAYQQMFALIDHFDCEVAWMGTVNRIDETHFQITKILLYPQRVTSVTVTTDQAEYAKWFSALPVETIRTLKFQGHSHVNMGTSPSSTDLQDQWDTINNAMKPDGYQIFMIWNKKREYNVRVVDKAANAIYEGKDVKVTVDGFEADRFLEGVDDIVKKYVVSYGGWNGNGTPGNYGAGNFVGKTTAGANWSANGSKGTSVSTAKTTVTGGSAPKIPVNTVAKNEADDKLQSACRKLKAEMDEEEADRYPLVDYYNDYPEELEQYGNSSCAPYRN